VSPCRSRSRAPRPLRALLLLLGIAAGPALAVGPAAAAPLPRLSDPAPRVLVLAVPDLRWSDLSADRTPAMWRLLAEGSAGVLSVKSAYQLAGCADGLLTLGAGDRAAAEAESAEPMPCTGGRPDQYAAVDRRIRTTSGLGALGAALRAHGLRTAALGGGATLGLPGADVAAPLSAGLPGTGGADLVLAVDDEVYEAAAAQRAAAVQAADVRVGALVDPLPAGSTVLLVGSSDRPSPPGSTGPREDAHLHVALARGPAFPPGYLSSPSTQRAPYIELIDLAPTVLELVGAPVPSEMVGRPWHAADGPASATARAAALRDLDVKAVQGARWRPPFMWSLALVSLLVVVLALAVADRDPRSKARRVTVLGCYLVAALPLGSWLVQVVPWWRWNILVLPVLLLAIAGVTGAVAIAAGRRVASRGLLVVVSASALLLVADLLTHSRLQTSALLGDSPITAGRFFGAGNTAFGVLAASALLGVALGCAGPADRRRRSVLLRAGLAGLLLFGVALVDAAPTLGADLGGALALMPSALVVVLLLARVRLSVRRGLAALAVGAVPVVLVALWDYHRPPDRRTHIGRFVAQVMDGSAGSVVSRKLAANLGQLVSSPFLPLVIGTVVVVAVALLRHRPRLDRALRATPGLGPALVGVTLCAVLGGLLNDSGVTVTGIMLSVALPTVTALALRADPVDTR
jgi:hypothetical protein